MQKTAFVTVVQRRKISIDASLLALVEPLFAIETHMSFEERVALGATAMNLPMGFVACEIGSYLGASTCFLAASASLRNGVVHCIDTWDNRAMDSEPVRDTYSDFLHNTEPFRELIVPHRGEAADLAAQVPNELDLLFLDGDHSYEMTKADLVNYGPKLKVGGLLLLHDSHLDSVQKALQEYLTERKLDKVTTTQSLSSYRSSVQPGEN